MNYLQLLQFLQAVPPLIYPALEGAGHAAGAVVAGEDSSGALGSKDNADGPQEDLVNNNSYVSIDAIPAYDGKAYVAVNNNEPFFYGQRYDYHCF